MDEQRASRSNGNPRRVTTQTSLEESRSTSIIPTGNLRTSGFERIHGQASTFNHHDSPYTGTPLNESPPATPRSFTGHRTHGYEPNERERADMARALELVQVEKELAERYGCSEDYDPPDILARARIDTPGALHDLNELYNLRMRTQLPRQLPQSRRQPSSALRHRVNASRFWGVIVGVNAYEDAPLLGSVEDAFRMKHLLIDVFGVPREQIKTLVGIEERPSPDNSCAPTRANIIKALRDLVDNRLIRHGDNIVIYFSGHGTSYTESDYENYSDLAREAISYIAGDGHPIKLFPIEALCPIDRNTIDSDGSPVPDISDREINAILTEIAHAKGHHITVILDCCHSGGATRNAAALGIRKSIPPLEGAALIAMFRIGSKTLQQFPGHHSLWAPGWRPDMKSHVILAACKDHEFAREGSRGSQYYGIFTDSLVNVLKSSFRRTGMGTTYADLGNMVKSGLYQTPVVAGDRRHSYLWYQT